ncbi:MAG: protein kinase domain-containing protein [Candidatus Sumerlaeia bacterium]
MKEFYKGAVIDGRYEILSLLGAGGMGRVYMARQLNLDRTVAIKVPSDAVMENEEFLTRFIREGRTCAQVAHSNIVAIYDVHSEDRPYIVMEFVDGQPLNKFLQAEHTNLFVSDILRIVEQVCSGLSAAHAKDVVHRDIKPANIVITTHDQTVKVMDFGIAHLSDKTALTTSGSMMGTPYYMAPEQIKGESVSAQTDLYALACVVYHILTGRLVFDGEVATLIYKHVSEQPKAPCDVNPMLPEEMNAVLLKALNKNMHVRQGSAMEFHRELSKALRPISSLPYTQIFPEAGRPIGLDPTVKTRQPTASSHPTETKVPSAMMQAEPEETAPVIEPEHSSSTDKKEQEADEPIRPDLPSAEVTAPLDRDLAPHEAGAPAAQDDRAEQMVRPATNKAAIFGTLVLLLITIAAAVIVIMPRIRGGNESPQTENPVSPENGSSTSAIPEDPDSNPLAESTLPAVQEMRWLMPESETLVSGEEDFFMAWWTALPPASGKRVYRVELTALDSGQVLMNRKTTEDRLAIPIQNQGAHRFRVEALDAEGQVEKYLEKQFDVQ